MLRPLRGRDEAGEGQAGEAGRLRDEHGARSAVNAGGHTPRHGVGGRLHEETDAPGRVASSSFSRVRNVVPRPRAGRGGRAPRGTRSAVRL